VPLSPVNSSRFVAIGTIVANFFASGHGIVDASTLRGSMSAIRRSPRHVRLVLVAILALSGVGAGSGACSLNPQPIPPGFEPDAGFGTPPENSDGPADKGAATADASFADGAGGGGPDSGAPDALAVPSNDAGLDAADAGDAIADAADGE
jgi:hypothetical protein